MKRKFTGESDDEQGVAKRHCRGKVSELGKDPPVVVVVAVDAVLQRCLPSFFSVASGPMQPVRVSVGVGRRTACMPFPCREYRCLSREVLMDTRRCDYF